MNTRGKELGFVYFYKYLVINLFMVFVGFYFINKPKIIWPGNFME